MPEPQPSRASVPRIEPVSLRERKKLKTRADIRRQAMRLFQQKGYAETTVEEIAAAAEVSPSTFFRYFTSKERVALTDDLDPILIAAFVRQPAELSVLDALRQAITQAFAEISEDDWATDLMRQQLISSVPELRAAYLTAFQDTIQMVAHLAADKIGRQADDFEVQVFAGAVTGGMLGVMKGNSGANPLAADQIDRAFDFIAAGLPLH
jgi:AcrR family transcriptional regulator